jgi:hypothetical protein
MPKIRNTTRRTMTATPIPMPILAPVPRLEMVEGAWALSSSGSVFGGVTMGASNAFDGCDDAGTGVSKETGVIALSWMDKAWQSCVYQLLVYMLRVFEQLTSHSVEAVALGGRPMPYTAQKSLAKNVTSNDKAIVCFIVLKDDQVKRY